ncbi:MAG: rhamnan synthesis F family protein [Coxiellaceae bacterium]|nr:rhamnan synthesis F family protein [Coxiellaceae bacterium]
MSAQCELEQQPLLLPTAKFGFSLKRQLLRPLYHVPLVKHLCYRADRLLAVWRRSTVLFDWQDDKPAQQNLCVFAHYDADGEVKPYVLLYLQQLVGHGFAVVFVTTGALSAAARQQLMPICQRIIIRNNCGLDFMSYKVGLQLSGDLSEYKQLLLTNDSFFVSAEPIKRVLQLAQRSDIDVCSLTDCEQHHYHLQSFFLLFKPRVFLGANFAKFWQRLLPLSNKSNIVQYYEIGLSRQLQAAGFCLKALCPVAKMRRDLASNAFRLPAPIQQQLIEWLGKKLNPTFCCWWLLIKYYQCPMIKRDLLVRNPMRLNLDHWQQILARYSDYPVELIERALETRYERLEQ